MKRSSSLHQRPGLVFGLAVLCAGLLGADAATLTPGATGDAAVAASIAGRANLALATAGSAAFSSSDLNASYAFGRVNDGVIDHTGNSWIALTASAGEFVGVALSAPANVSAVVWHGQTGYNGRSGATWRLEYTTDASPTPGSTWTEIGTYTYTEAGCASPMPRSFFSFAPISGVTGLRLVLGAATCGAQLCVQEFEAYEPITTPPSITGQPVGATVVQGSDFTLSVTAEGAESFQWRKNGNNIAGATGPTYTISDVKTNDAGTYTVLASNPAATVTSDPAELIVTPAPVFATYAEAVLTDNPIHYYPLDETSGTTANDLGSLATTGGTHVGGITVGENAATTRLGKAIRLNGAAGTLVDLGLFHPESGSITVEAWARLDTDARSASYHAIVARWDGSYELDFNTADTGNLVVRRDGNGFGIAAGNAPSPRAQWHHLVGVFANGVVTLYVNGVKGSDQDIGGVLQNAGPTPDRIMIGATRDGIFNFKGLIDEVAIYDYGLSAAQIRSHFRTAQPAEAPSLTIQNAVIVSWPSFPPGYVLQSATDINGPYSDYTGPTYITGNNINAPVPLGPEQQFFKLIKP